MILDNIHSHDDLQKLSDQQREQLCGEIRQFLVEQVAQTGGHLASNLGVVELSVAIETVFDTNKDRLVFDVGHQSYVHKLLTGRRQGFSDLRQFGGMAGFPKPRESRSDAFVAGHASSSVSIALGMARARTLQKEDYRVIALIGDGATTGGIAYEGLNDAGDSNEPLIVILNDNEMSIDRNVGAMSKHLSRLRTGKRYYRIKKKWRKITSMIPGGNYLYRLTHRLKNWLKPKLLQPTVFENMGFRYLGPVDGHDLSKLVFLLHIAREMNAPVLLHVITTKGKGYAPAEADPSRFHGIGKFDPVTGQSLDKPKCTFSDAFGREMMALAGEDPTVCAITAAMPGGTGLLSFKKAYPNRCFDVGIAEEHAVSMAGGLAKQGMKPVVAIYSTFLQRAYDMILQDVCLQKLHVVFAVDRAGLVGEDGETHHGIFDVGFLRQAPGMEILCPASTMELQKMLRWAVKDCTGPVAVRYPRGGDGGYTGSGWEETSSVCVHRQGRDALLITYGSLIRSVLSAADLLAQAGIHPTVLRLTRIHPLPGEEIRRYCGDGVPVFVVEETLRGSGLREAIAWELPGHRVLGRDLGTEFVTHGAMEALYHHCGLDPVSISELVREGLSYEK